MIIKEVTKTATLHRPTKALADDAEYGNFWQCQRRKTKTGHPVNKRAAPGGGREMCLPLIHHQEIWGFKGVIWGFKGEKPQ